MSPSNYASKVINLIAIIAWPYSGASTSGTDNDDIELKGLTSSTASTASTSVAKEDQTDSGPGNIKVLVLV